MKEICEYEYSSRGWKPLHREEGLGIMSAYSRVEDVQSVTGAGDAAPEKERTVVPEKEQMAAPENEEIFRLLSEISSKLDAINGCTLDQCENLRLMFSRIEESMAVRKKTKREPKSKPGGNENM